MKKFILAGVVMAIIAVYAWVWAISQPSTTEVVTQAQEVKPKSKYDVGPPDADEIHELVNKERKKAGLQPLTYNKILEQSACAKNRDMIDKDYWGHVSPEGHQPWGNLLNAGYSYLGAAENLVYSSEFDATSRSWVNSWMNSKGHRANILRADMKETGICVTHTNRYQGLTDINVDTQHFAIPA